VRLIEVSRRGDGCGNGRGEKHIPVDVTNGQVVAECFVQEPPAAVIHLAACADANWCQEHPEESEAVNVRSVAILSALCVEAGVPLVVASTDLVFDGNNAPYAEDAAPSPISLYAAQKVQAEREARRIHPAGAVVLRFPLMYGPPSIAGRDPAKILIDAHRFRVPARLFVDEFRTPASTRAIGEATVAALSWEAGIWHLGGPERVSRFEFGRRWFAWMGWNDSVLLPLHQEDLKMSAPRPRDVSLDSRKAFACGYRPLALEEEWAADAYYASLKTGTTSPV
jgi:dTDP-4-dehydrorhamnose reductase